MHICIMTADYTVRPPKKEDQLSLNAGQRYCRMLQGEHSAFFTFIKLPFVIKIFVLSFLNGCLRHRSTSNRTKVPTIVLT